MEKKFSSIEWIYVQSDHYYVSYRIDKGPVAIISSDSPGIQNPPYNVWVVNKGERKLGKIAVLGFLGAFVLSIVYAGISEIIKGEYLGGGMAILFGLCGCAIAHNLPWAIYAEILGTRDYHGVKKDLADQVEKTVRLIENGDPATRRNLIDYRGSFA